MNARLSSVMLILAAAACSEREMTTDAIQAISASDAAAPPVAHARSKGAMAEGAAFASAPQPAPQPADRRIIRSGDIRIQLDDVAAGSRSADSIAVAVGGVVANSRISQGERGETEAHIVLRVPAPRFSEALDALRRLGRVRIDNTNAEDVTRAYNDLEIRLAVKREMVGRLRALLANRTARLADILAAERELGRAIAEMEQMEGERRYMDSQVAMSTISASLYHAPVPGPGSFLDPIREAIRQSVALLGRSVAAVISGIVIAAPWVLIALVGWRLRRVFRRRLVAPADPAA